jgi:pyruvate/2-oxoglutarate dehydrogenase complex dihydrolipoamide acyltransferase (E2) component
MPIEITMPRLSDTMEAGTVIKWNVKEGDSVKSGSVVADIETDKATMEMQCFDDGRMAAILVEPGRQVKVGTTIALVALEGEDLATVKSGGMKKSAPAQHPHPRRRPQLLLPFLRQFQSCRPRPVTAWKAFRLRAAMDRACV